MRKGIISFALFLTISLFPAYSATPPKAGTVCSKQGISKTYQGKKFTCIKSGKKLVWNNGVLIKKKDSVATPTVTPTTKSGQGFASQAMLSISAQMKNAANSNLKIDFLVAKDSNKLFVDLVPITITEDARFWSNFYNPKVTLPVAIAQPGDAAWLNEQFAKYSFSLHPWRYDQINNQNNKEIMIFDADENPSTDSVLYFVLGKDRPTLTPTFTKNVITHEFVHIVQVGLTKARNGRIPCWSTEGSAVFYGNAITASRSGNPEADYLNNRRNWLAQLNLKTVLAGKSETEILDLLKKSESDFRVCAEPLYFGYSAGSLMSEILIAEHGHEKFVQWWIKSKDNDWRKEFTALFGVEVDSFYRNVAIPYILTVAKTP